MPEMGVRNKKKKLFLEEWLKNNLPLGLTGTLKLEGKR